MPRSNILFSKDGRYSSSHLTNIFSFYDIITIFLPLRDGVYVPPSFESRQTDCGFKCHCVTSEARS